MEIDQEGVRQRIKAIKDSSFMNQTEFAEAIGIKQGDLSLILSGKRSIGTSIVNKIIIAFSINKTWLLTGQGERESTDKDSSERSQDATETVKELMAAIKRRDEHVEALIRINEKHADNFEALIKVNEKHADNFTELLKQIKKTDALKGKSVECADASGFSEK